MRGAENFITVLNSKLNSPLLQRWRAALVAEIIVMPKVPAVFFGAAHNSGRRVSAYICGCGRALTAAGVANCYVKTVDK